jgi:hypothetical protein
MRSAIKRLPKTGLVDGIPHPEIRSQLFHNVIAGRLLYRIGRNKWPETAGFGPSR